MGKGAQGTVQIQKCVESINRYAFEDDNFLPFALLEKSNRSLLQCDKARRACDKILKNEFIRLGEASYWWCVSVSSFPPFSNGMFLQGKMKEQVYGKIDEGSRSVRSVPSIDVVLFVLTWFRKMDSFPGSTEPTCNTTPFLFCS